MVEGSAGFYEEEAELLGVVRMGHEEGEMGEVGMLRAQERNNSELGRFLERRSWT